MFTSEMKELGSEFWKLQIIIAVIRLSNIKTMALECKTSDAIFV
jgi:hypothetical protein